MLTFLHGLRVRAVVAALALGGQVATYAPVIAPAIAVVIVTDSAFAQTPPEEEDNMPADDYNLGMPPAAMATRTSSAMGPYLGVVFVLAIAVALFTFAKGSFVGMARKRK